MRRAFRRVCLLAPALAWASWSGVTGTPVPAYAAPGCETSTTPPPQVTERATVPWSVAAAGLGRLSGIADGTGVTVAVIDSGVRPVGPLAGQVLPGFDLLGGTDGRQDCVGHGTAVASIIAATPARGTGFRGLAPGARILPIRVSEAQIVDGRTTGQATDAAGFATAIRDAVRRHAQVINLSVVIYTDAPVVRQAIHDAIAAGAVVVASVGNGHAASGPDPTPYPAAYPGVIGVGSIDPSGARSPASEVGTFVKIVAPGGSVVAQRLPDGVAVMDGTSFAVPYVAATAALVRQAYPRLSGAQVSARILATADPPVDGGPSDEYGNGVADPYRAVTEALPPGPALGPGRPGNGSDQPGARMTAGPGSGPSSPPGTGPSARPGTPNGHRAAPGAVAGGVGAVTPRDRRAAVAWSALAITAIALMVAALAAGAPRGRPTGGRPGWAGGRRDPG